MLQNCGQALIQRIFEAVMVSSDCEHVLLEVRPPIADCLYLPDEFPFISSQFSMLGCHCSAEKCYQRKLAVLGCHCPCLAIDENIVKKTRTKRRKKG